MSTEKKATKTSNLTGIKRTRCFIYEPYKIFTSSVISYNVNRDNSNAKESAREKYLIRLTRLQASIHSLWPNAKILEVSDKSNRKLGRLVSIDRLKLDNHSLYSVIEASKFYEDDVVINDLLDKKPQEIKKLEEEGLVKPANKRRNKLDSTYKLKGYKYNDLVFPDYPTTYFYDFMYCKALDKLDSKLKNEYDEALAKGEELPNIKSLKCLERYDTFTDINYSLAQERRPSELEWKHLDYDVASQARAVCIYTTLRRKKLLKRALSSPEEYYNIVYENDFLEDEEKETE